MVTFQRELHKQLVSWKDSANRKPLVLQGARQVGKTVLLKTFGTSAFREVAYFNFEEQPDLKQFFENTKDVRRIVQNLSLVHGAEINPDTTLIIFDEIQECIAALNTLKYFSENAPEYAVAAAGSLLGVALGRESSFPVGKVDFLQLYPLSFIEFLTEANAELAEYIRNLEGVSNIPDIFYNQLIEIFRTYFICGGMPEAAATLLESKSIETTQKVLRDILNGYQMDFAKHAPSKDFARITYLLNSIPAHLSKENKKFLYKAVKTGARAREYEDALLWLIQMGVVYKVMRCSKPYIPLSAYDDVSAFKLYMADVGLLRTLAQLDASVFTEISKLFTEFKGSLTENYVLQSLMPQFIAPPRYWTSEGQAEVDFLIQHRNVVIPCEVKADENVRSKSLSVYAQKFKPPLRIRFSLKNVSYDEGLLNIPLFLTDHTSQFMDALLK